MTSVLSSDIISSPSGNLIIKDREPGSVVAAYVIRNSTRTALSLSNSAIIFGGSFTKLLPETKIIAKCTVFGDGYNSGNCGVGMRLDNTWDYGCAYQYDGAWGAYQTTVIVGQGYWDTVSAGSHTISFGWNNINGVTTDRPFNYVNPNNQVTSEPRNQQMVSSIIVYECF